MASPFSWPVLVPYALRAPAPVNLGVRHTAHIIAMRIKIKTEDQGSLLPSAAHVIAGIPEDFIFNNEHGLKHPSSAYATSLRLITKEWTVVLNSIDALRYALTEETRTHRLLDTTAAYVQLLHKIHEHHDACTSVVRSLCRASEAKENKINSVFLNSANPIGWKQFRTSTKPHRDDLVGAIVNKIKHDQAELNSVYLTSARDSRFGYYLKGLISPNTLGPDPVVHAGANTAFSFFRDMLIHLWWIYKTGDLLRDCVRSVIYSKYGEKITPMKKDFPEMQWASVVARCSKLPPDFFPDEIDKPHPRIIYANSPECLTLEFPSSARAHRLLGEYRISAFSTVDGAHLTEQAPYFNYSAK
ncbi:hypothetical protein [Aquabacterium sp.]|uniref:hypothetical protein n=1 Tax=Aquabacterium sp. TaxID=1872578 RepID=UPI0025BF32B2|nr:hypothetical protein [Aquabacterium sp.]